MPPQYPTYYFHKYYSTPGLEVVTIAVESANGLHQGELKDLYSSQAALVARMPAELREVAGDRWGDAEIIAEATALVVGLGGILIERPSPAPPPEAPAPPDPAQPPETPDPGA